MTGYAVFAGIVCMYVSDRLYRSVVARARPLFPESEREERKANYSLGALLWQPAFPDGLRRKYLWSGGFAVLAALFVTIIAYNTRHPNWAAFFAGVLLLLTAQVLVNGVKYLRRARH
jgi:hypothetical protein